MAWVLQNPTSAAIGGKLFVDIPCTIGRSREATIQLEGDGAISRHHATITVTRAPNTSTPIVTLMDESKFGSSLTRLPPIVGGEPQKIKCVPKVPLQLLAGDILMFGSKLSTALELKYQPLVFCCSRLSKELKGEVERGINQLGGRIVTEWTDDCTHLVMESLYATEKVLLALIKGAELIDPVWIQEAVKSKSPLLPDPARHVPQPKEAGFMAAALAIGRDVRRRMFDGRTFVFLAPKQQRAMERIVKLTGGLTINAFANMDDAWWSKLRQFAVVFPPDTAMTADLEATKAQLLRLGFGDGIISDTAIGTAVLDGVHQFHFMPPSSSSASQSTVASSSSSSNTSRHHGSASSAAIAPRDHHPPPPPKPARVGPSAAAAAASSSSSMVKKEKERSTAAAIAAEDLTADEEATVASSSTVAIGSNHGPSAAVPPPSSSSWGERKRAPPSASSSSSASVGGKRKDPPVSMMDDAIPMGGTATQQSVTSVTSKNSAMALPPPAPSTSSTSVKVEPRTASRPASAAPTVDREHKDTPLSRAISSAAATKRKREIMDNDQRYNDNDNNDHDREEKEDHEVNAFRAANSMLPSSSAINALLDPLLEGFVRKKQKPLSAAAAAPIDAAAVRSRAPAPVASIWAGLPNPAASSSSATASLVPFRSRVKLENGVAGGGTDASAVASMDTNNGETKAPVVAAAAAPIASIPMAMSSQSVAAGGVQPSSSQPGGAAAANGGGAKRIVKAETSNNNNDNGVAGATELMAELEISHSERERVRWLRSLPPGQNVPAISLAARQAPIMDLAAPNFKVFRQNKNSQAARRAAARFVPFDCSNLEDDYQAPQGWLEEEKREDKRRGVLQDMFVSNQKSVKAVTEPLYRRAATAKTKSKSKGKAAPKKRATKKKKKDSDDDATESDEQQESSAEDMSEPDDDDDEPKPSARKRAAPKAKTKAAAKSRAKKK